jgi:hypothetical protein
MNSDEVTETSRTINGNRTHQSSISSLIAEYEYLCFFTFAKMFKNLYGVVYGWIDEGKKCI